MKIQVSNNGIYSQATRNIELPNYNFSGMPTTLIGRGSTPVRMNNGGTFKSSWVKKYGKGEQLVPGSDVDISKLFSDYESYKPETEEKKDDNEVSLTDAFSDRHFAPSIHRQNTELNERLDNILASHLLNVPVFEPLEELKKDDKKEDPVEPTREPLRIDIKMTDDEQPVTSTVTPSSATKGKLLEATTRRKGYYEKTESGRRQFVHDLNQAFIRAGVKNEEMRKVLVAQAALESGYGSGSTGGGDYNYGNLTTGKYWTGDWREANDRDKNGNWIKQRFRSYASMDDYAKDKLAFIGAKSRYKVDIDKDDPMTYIDKIVRGGYAEDPKYRASLTDIYKNWIGKRWN